MKRSFDVYFKLKHVGETQKNSFLLFLILTLRARQLTFFSFSKCLLFTYSSRKILQKESAGFLVDGLGRVKLQSNWMLFDSKVKVRFVVAFCTKQTSSLTKWNARRIRHTVKTLTNSTLINLYLRGHNNAAEKKRRKRKLVTTRYLTFTSSINTFLIEQ